MTEPQASFSEFAGVYDRFMHYIDYPGWVRYACEILNLYNIRGRKLLDIACGTGTCVLLFAEKGFEVTGIDASQEMIAQALEKAGSDKHAALFQQQDMRDFRLGLKFNIATSFYDSINYLLTAEDVGRAFACAFESLEEGGAFIFDMNTEYALSEIWGSKTMKRNEGGVSSVWKNEYDPLTKICTLCLTWLTRENGKNREHVEIHRERAYGNAEVKSLLEKAGFKRIIIYAHPTFSPPFELTARIMVVALK